MRGRRQERGKTSFGCIVWLIIVALVGYFLWKVVPVKVATSTFHDVMTEQAAFGSIKSVPQIEYEILRRARELNIPVTKENLKITRVRESIKIEAHYTITLEFFGGAYTYVWRFDPLVERPLFAV